MLTNEDIYPGWATAGLEQGWARDSSLIVHSTLASPTVATLNAEIAAASAAANPLGVPRVVQVQGNLVLDDDVAMRSLCVVRETPTEVLTVTTGLSLSRGIGWIGGTPDARTVTASGDWGTTTATINDPSNEIERGVWQFGNNSPSGPGGQQVEVVEIDGNVITLKDPLTVQFTDIEMKRNNGGDSDSIYGAGWEGGTFDCAHDIARLFEFQGCREVWLTDAVVAGVDATGNHGIQESHVYIRQAYHWMVDGCTFVDADEHGDGAQGYGVNNQSHSSQGRITNNVFRRLRHSILNSGGASGNVILWNDTDEIVHPNHPKGIWPEISGHGRFDATLIAFNTTNGISLVDAGQPGEHNGVGWNTVRECPIYVSGYNGIIGGGNWFASNSILGTVERMRTLKMPSIATDSTAGNPSPPRYLWHEFSLDGNGEYPPDTTSPDPFADQGLGEGYYLPDPADVDISAIIIDTEAQPSNFPALSWIATPQAPIATTRSLVATEVKHLGETSTVPLGAHSGPNRWALVVASWQGEGHDGPNPNPNRDMGNELGDLAVFHRTNRGAANRAGLIGWFGPIPTGTTNVDIPLSHQGGGWMLRVYEGSAIEPTMRDVVVAEGTQYGISGIDDAIAGAGNKQIDADIIGVVATNANVDVTAQALTIHAPASPWYSELVAASSNPGANGTLSWGSPQWFTAGTVEVPNPEVDYGWVDLGNETIQGITVGTGPGDDVDTDDDNGITAAAGDGITSLDKWSITADNLPPQETWSARVELPESYDPSAGYSARFRYETPGGLPLSDWVTSPETIVGGETEVVFTAVLSPTGQPPQVGQTRRFHTRIEIMPDTASNLRPVDPGPIAVEGRLGRPKRVELWRSQGGGSIPTLTRADRYVDPRNGNDSADGLTRGTAWRSMLHAFRQTHGLGLAVGYLSGNIVSALYRNPDDPGNDGQGSGTSFTTGMSTHYVLEGETCTIRGDFKHAPAIWLKNFHYIQIAGFELENTNNSDGGINYASGVNVDDYDAGPDDTHHIILADMKFDRFNSAGCNGLKVRYVRVLGCEIYDCGWWHSGGSSGTTWNDIDVDIADKTPAGVIDGNGIDVWIEGCYVTGSRQKIDSHDIGGIDPATGQQRGVNQLWDGNAYIFDYSHVHKDQYIRVVWLFCIAHNTGGKSFNSYQGADEIYVIGCAGFYGGRHLEYVLDENDPTHGMNPAGQSEFMVQSYPESGGKQTLVHWWNNVAVAGTWMSGRVAYETWSGHTTGNGPNIVNVDARNNVRTSTYANDAHSTVIGDPLVVNGSLNGHEFDPRPRPNSPLLSGGDLSLFARAGVSVDFAGEPIGQSGPGHVGPYSKAVAA